jgi:hypothetical protein
MCVWYGIPNSSASVLMAAKKFASSLKLIGILAAAGEVLTLPGRSLSFLSRTLF